MAAPFSNEPLSVDQLPRLDDSVFVSVDPRYMWGRLVGAAISAVVIITIAGVVVWRTEAVAVPGAIAGGVLAIVGVAAIMLVLESRRLAYQVREHDVSLRRGIIRHVVETIPFSRVQHVNVGRGVIERWFGLATLEISSAGPDMSIPGLAIADADRVKQLIAQRADVGEEVAEEEQQQPPADDPGAPTWPPPPSP